MKISNPVRPLTSLLSGHQPVAIHVPTAAASSAALKFEIGLERLKGPQENLKRAQGEATFELQSVMTRINQWSHLRSNILAKWSAAQDSTIEGIR